MELVVLFGGFIIHLFNAVQNTKNILWFLGIIVIIISKSLPVNLRNYIHILAHMTNDLEPVN